MTPERVKEKVEALRLRMEKARKLAALFEHQDWGQMTQWLANEIDAVKSGLCNAEMPAGMTTLLRGQYWALRKVADLPAFTTAEIGSIVKELQGLQVHIDRLHTRRPDELSTVKETVRQMSST